VLPLADEAVSPVLSLRNRLSIGELDRLPDAPPNSSRLRSAARLLSLLELGSLAERYSRAAAAHDHRQAVDIAALRAAVRRSSTFAAVPAGLGACQMDGTPSDIRSRLLAWHGPSLSICTTSPNEINNLGDYSGVYGAAFA
jgi:hypothetical protein